MKQLLHKFLNFFKLFHKNGAIAKLYVQREPVNHQDKNVAIRGSNSYLIHKENVFSSEREVVLRNSNPLEIY